ncbi:MAG: tripartite tricarboxylate transporter TctB family protein [Pseudorhizobium sp.]
MAAERERKYADLGFGAGAAIVVTALMYDANDLGDRARLFPMAVLWCLLIAALWMLVQGAASFWRSAAPVDVSNNHGLVRALAPSLVIVAAGVLLVTFGFYLTAPLVIFVVHALHTYLSTGARPKRRMLATGAALALIATAVIYLIFDILIGLPAPEGAIF